MQLGKVYLNKEELKDRSFEEFEKEVGPMLKKNKIDVEFAYKKVTGKGKAKKKRPSK